MSKSFEDLLSKVSECEMKKVAVAVAQDSAVLEAVVAAKERGIAEAFLWVTLTKSRRSRQPIMWM